MCFLLLIRLSVLLRFRTVFSIHDQFRQFNTIPWTGDRLMAKPLSTEHNAMQKTVNIHPCLEQDSKPWSHSSSCLNTICALGPTATGTSIFKIYLNKFISSENTRTELTNNEQYFSCCNLHSLAVCLSQQLAASCCISGVRFLTRAGIFAFAATSTPRLDLNQPTI
jgi:hypothetical protein